MISDTPQVYTLKVGDRVRNIKGETGIISGPPQKWVCGIVVRVDWPKGSQSICNTEHLTPLCWCGQVAVVVATDHYCTQSVYCNFAHAVYNGDDGFPRPSTDTLLDVPPSPMVYASPVPAMHTPSAPKRGRPSIYSNNAERQKAYRSRLKKRAD